MLGPIKKIILSHADIPCKMLKFFLLPSSLSLLHCTSVNLITRFCGVSALLLIKNQRILCLFTSQRYMGVILLSAKVKTRYKYIHNAVPFGVAQNTAHVNILQNAVRSCLIALSQPISGGCLDNEGLRPVCDVSNVTGWREL